MARAYRKLTRARLCEVLHVDPEKNNPWTWRIRMGNRKAGSEAGCISRYKYGKNHYERRIIGIDGEEYRSSHLMWLYMTGDFPPEGYEVDHINNDATDDRWANLRLATSSQSKVNRRAGGKTGIKGVDFHKASGLFRARIGPAKNVRFLGYFETEEEAGTAHDQAAKEMYGEWANTRTMEDPFDPLRHCAWCGDALKDNAYDILGDDGETKVALGCVKCWAKLGSAGYGEVLAEIDREETERMARRFLKAQGGKCMHGERNLTNKDPIVLCCLNPRGYPCGAACDLEEGEGCACGLMPADKWNVTPFPQRPQ